MFEDGQDYWITHGSGQGSDRVRGKFLRYEFPLVAFDVEGIRTIYSVNSGAFFSAEKCDDQAEKARQDANYQAMIG